MAEINKKYFYVLISVFLIGVLVSSFMPWRYSMNNMNMEDFNSMRMDMIHEKISMGNYKCCLQEACSYCLIKEGICDCLEEIVNGEHPCGECMGEILEGHGNPYLVEYFPRALVDELGENHLDEIKQIISEKY